MDKLRSQGSYECRYFAVHALGANSASVREEATAFTIEAGFDVPTLRINDFEIELPPCPEMVRTKRFGLEEPRRSSCLGSDLFLHCQGRSLELVYSPQMRSICGPSRVCGFGGSA